MFFGRQIILIFFALIFGGKAVFAAEGSKEERAYAAAIAAFQDAMWSRAETEFAGFVDKYPKSERIPEAILMQAQAELKQGKLPSAIALLSAKRATAGKFADQYVYWIGEAQYQNGDFSLAAQTFTSLAHDFPESTLRLRAVVEAAAALAQLNKWTQVAALLEEPGGVFQRAIQLDAADELVSRGRLLLAQAKLERGDFNGATAVLQSLAAQPLKTELDWQRAYLLYQVKMAAGDLNAALTTATNLFQISKLARDNGLSAESVAMRAAALEKLNRSDEAAAAYSENLSSNAPPENQRQAILKIAELAIAQKKFPEAGQSLEKFLAQFPDSPAADAALLTLGELHLKEYVAQPATNDLQTASTLFSQFLTTYTNSPLTGKAYLDRGWCDWIDGKIPESAADFKMALQKLPPSEDQAVARFKLGDALFKQNDFVHARENYRAVLNDFPQFPAVEKTLHSLALYQIVQASLKLNDVIGASNAMAQVLKFYPASPVADNSLLLVGEGYEDLNQPAKARELFQRFQKLYPTLPLRSQVELAIGRTYELEGNWPAAIGQYEGWLKNFPTNTFLPQVNYSLAWANFQAGNETNAFTLFTNFTAQFPTNELAPFAQWWVADHFYRTGTNFVDAEKNYQIFFQTWPTNPLAFQARMMAGRSAVGRLGYSDAIRYFNTLTTNADCPPDLNAQALFAFGSALMQMNSTDTNNPLANFQSATNLFGQIIQLYPTNELAALAWGEIGDCNLQLTNYDAATNAYAQTVNSSWANISARSQAQIGLGLALEKKAAASSGDDQKNLLQLALQNYLDVLYGNNLRDGETPDSFWVKKAGLQAAALAESLGEWQQAANVYQRLEKLLPPLRDSLEKKIAAAQEHFTSQKN
ncbi:MAG TPA: tetratricopeptide repeat protein [Verrucomicrobiae bacterium]|nr:tetratricopeptide repeat protein [Verrucomicrobiae bacterium]